MWQWGTHMQATPAATVLRLIWRASIFASQAAQSKLHRLSSMIISPDGSVTQRHLGLTARHSEVLALRCRCRSFGCSAHIGLIYSINPLVILTLVPIVGAISELFV